jgi:hypothetical protein
VPQLNNHVSQNIIDEKSSSKQLVSLFQKENQFEFKSLVKDHRQLPKTNFHCKLIIAFLMTRPQFFLLNSKRRNDIA